MDNIITLNLGISNAYLIKGRSGFILVDTGIRQKEENFKKILAQHSIDFPDIKLIIITHAHSDHFMHLGFLKNMTKAKVLCHENAKEWLIMGKDPPLTVQGFLPKLLIKLVKNDFSSYVPVEPDILVKDSYDLKEFGVDGFVIHTPGHSACSITIVIQRKWAIIGDILFSSLFNNKKPGFPIIVTDKSLVISSLEKIIETGAEKFLGGHGGPYNINDIKGLIEKQKSKV